MVVYRLALGLNQVAGLVAFFRNPQLADAQFPTGHQQGLVGGVSKSVWKSQQPHHHRKVTA
jgi:hypothetical protein